MKTPQTTYIQTHRLAEVQTLLLEGKDLAALEILTAEVQTVRLRILEAIVTQPKPSEEKPCNSHP